MISENVEWAGEKLAEAQQAYCKAVQDFEQAPEKTPDLVKRVIDASYDLRAWRLRHLEQQVIADRVAIFGNPVHLPSEFLLDDRGEGERELFAIQITIQDFIDDIHTSRQRSYEQHSLS